jgi:creatinine amidohydrolase/Fe(II)-dependent formamide hydrolase-like protein
MATAVISGVSVVAVLQTPPPTQQPPTTGGAVAGQQAPPAGGRQGRAGGPPSMGGGQCSASPYNCPDAPNPLPPPDTVWIEEMTWMDVRDAMKAGKTTIIISTGGIEPNGPWLALGKHNYVLKANCDAIARKLGDALCAPIVPFVPEGNLDTKSGHMASPGTISMREETYNALLSDIVMSMKQHGFEHIIMIGDSGGNGRGMTAVAERYTKEWGGKPIVAHVPEHYQYSTVSALLRQLGVTKEGQPDDGIHDDPGITLNMMVTDPQSVRWAERVKAGKATINGVSIADKEKALALGKQIVEMRATNTAAAIRKVRGK